MSDRWHLKARDPIEEAISGNVPANGAEVVVRVFGVLFQTQTRSTRQVWSSLGEAIRHVG